MHRHGKMYVPADQMAVTSLQMPEFQFAHNTFALKKSKQTYLNKILYKVNSFIFLQIQEILFELRNEQTKKLKIKLENSLTLINEFDS